MVNEIGSIGIVSAQGLAHAGRSQADRARELPSGGMPSSGSMFPERREVQLKGWKCDFSVLAGAKDEAAQLARSVRDASQALDRVGAVLKEMHRSVAMVKNFPPFPPGSEQRVQFIQGLNGLRKVLDALTVPPVDKGMELVFYPRESEFPDLDPRSASDAEVAVFGRAAEVAMSKLNASYSELQAQVEALPRINGDLPIPTVGEDSAEQVSQLAAGQMVQQGSPLLANADVLTQLGV